MKNGLAMTTLLAAAFAVAPKLSYAEDARWESLRVFTLSGGQSVAVAVPSEWSQVDATSGLGKARVLRFRDQSGAEITIPVAALERASADKRVFRPQLTTKFAQN